MIKRGAGVGVLMFAALLAMPAEGSDLVVFGSYWDTSDMGNTAGAGVKFSLGDGPLAFEVRGTYFPDLQEDFRDVIDPGNPDIPNKFEVSGIPIDLGVNWNFAKGEPVNFFLAGGGTYYMLDTNVFEIDDEFGFYAGTGLEVGSGSMSFYAEALYRSVEGSIRGELEGNDFVIDEAVDLDLSGITINAGVSFHF